MKKYKTQAEREAAFAQRKPWSEMNIGERTDVLFKIETELKKTITYMKKATSYLQGYWIGMPVPEQEKDVLETCIDVAIEIVESLPENFFLSEKVQDRLGLFIGGVDPDDYNRSDEILEKAKELALAVQDRRSRGRKVEMLMKFENTNGRTAEEAENFILRAAKIREELGL